MRTNFLCFLFPISVPTVLFQNGTEILVQRYFFKKEFGIFSFLLSLILSLSLFGVGQINFLTPKYTVRTKERFKVSLPTMSI